MKDISKASPRRGHNEGNIRQRTDGRWEVRLSAGIDYKTGKPRRTSTCCNTRQEAIAILQQQAHEVRTQGWRDPMSVTLGEWYEYWLDTYMRTPSSNLLTPATAVISTSTFVCWGKSC